LKNTSTIGGRRIPWATGDEADQRQRGSRWKTTNRITHAPVPTPTEASKKIGAKGE